MRLIDADAIVYPYEGTSESWQAKVFRSLINNAPTIEPKSEPKSGEWIPARYHNSIDGGEKHYCSNCGKTSCEKSNYCPNCGTKMK